MRSVYLDSDYNEFYVSEEGYQEIVTLVKAYQICKQEKHPFSDDNPCVGKNLCLKHLLEKQSSLSYLGVARTDVYGRRIHRYQDLDGFIFTSTEDCSGEASKTLRESLAHHGFVPPATITYRDKTVEYDSYYATVYGTLHTASVIVLTFEKIEKKSSESVKGVFLLYNDGTHKELVKRGEHKQLFTRANALLEATKDAKGIYHVPPNDYTTTVVHDDDCYAIISQLESALFDVIRQLSPKIVSEAVAV